MIFCLEITTTRPIKVKIGIIAFLTLIVLEVAEVATG